MRSEFKNIKLGQLNIMLNILFSAKESYYEFIERSYQAYAMNFKETLKFLEGLQFLNISNNEIKLHANCKDSISEIRKDEEKFKHYMIENILNVQNKLSEEVYSYLGRFKESNHSYIYAPSLETRVKESDIRNFLIELGVVQYNHNEDRYEVADFYIPIVIKSLSKRRKSKEVTPEELSEQLKSKDELGKAAEHEIFKYEKIRLAGHVYLLNSLEMTSELDVTAGYDIKSYEVESKEDNLIPRFIEVKAVSGIDYRFNWSRTEVETAKSYGAKYYLYLLPVVSGHKKYNFDIDKLKIIKDPFVEVFMDSSNWEKQEELYTLWVKSGEVQ